MSSGGWEVVGKSKKDKSNGKTAKMTKAEKKKFIENAPKVEDFLPLSQVKSLYDNLDSGKENKKPAKEKESKSKENEEKKKQQKQQHQQQHTEKKKQEPKEKPPKSINEALNAINAEELDDILATARARFPDAPLLWLKDLAAFLNAKIPVDKEDAIFSGKSKDYPLSVVPKPVSSILEKAVESAGQQTAQLFYEVTLATMASDMAKGVAVVGHKIFLQLLAQTNPQVTIASIHKLIGVRNSYQNRKPIGLSLLWAVSQAGRRDLAVGLKVWHEIMFPMLEMKSYAGYVVQILNDLVFGHENVQNLSLDLYLDIVEDACLGKQNASPAVGGELAVSIERLRSILFKNKSINHSKMFETLVGKISPKTNADYRDELVNCLAICLTRDVHGFSVWRDLYTKHLYPSNLLVAYINAKWDTFHAMLNVKALKETLIVFQTTNERWKKGKDERIAVTCNRGCKALLDKMTASTRRKFPWRRGSILLLLLIGAIVAYDCGKHGSFEASSTGKFLQNSGIGPYGQGAWIASKAYTVKGLEYVEASWPEYYKLAVDACVTYKKLAGDMYLITKNLFLKMHENTNAYVAKKGPVLRETIEHYAPGILDQTYNLYVQAIDLAKTYSRLAAEYVVKYSTDIVRWLQKNVFVGKLSPENLQNYATRAIDTTQTFASQTYDWVYEKVQTLSKVP